MCGRKKVRARPTYEAAVQCIVKFIDKREYTGK
jgi:hypothetical protein